jgi:uncharacterized protein YhaN
MRLRRLDLTRYGKFTEKVLDFGAAEGGKPDFHIVYGLNEAGKSTAFSAWLDLLFGIPERSPYNFLHAYSSMQIGGVLEFDGKSHELVRLKQRVNALTDARGQPVNEALLSAALGGIGRDAYRTMFSLDDQSLKEGGAAIVQSEGDLGALLFSASAGLADIGKTLASVREEADGLHRRRARNSELAQMKARLAGLKERRAEIDVQASAFAALALAEAEARKAHEETETELATARTRQGELARLLRALPAANEIRRIAAALAPLADLPRPPRELAALLPRLVTDETRLDTRRRGLDDMLERLERELAELGAEDPLLGLSQRLEALADSRARYRSAEPDLPRRRAALAEREAALALLLKSLGRPGEADAAGLILPARLVSRLRGLIEERSGMETALASSRRELERVTGALGELAGEPGASDDANLGERDWQRLAALVERLQRSDRPHRLAMERRGLARLAEQATAALKALGPVALPAETLQLLTLPDRRQFDRWRDQAVDLSRRRSTHRDRIRQAETERAEAQARIRVIRDGADVLDDEAARALRAERERLWQAHLETLDGKSADAFEKALRRDDTASEQRLERAHDLAEIRQAKATLILADATLERERALLDEVETEFARLDATLDAAFPHASSNADEDLEDRIYRLQTFATRHAEWTGFIADEQQARERVEELAAEMEAGLEELAAALSALGLSVPRKADPEALFALAEKHIAAAEKETALRARAEERLRDLREEAKRREREHKTAAEAAAAWQAEWEKSVAETWFEPDATINEVRAMLDALTELPAILNDREQLAHRIALMEQDQMNFAEEVKALCALAGLDCSHPDIRRSDEALLSRFTEARSAEEQACEKRRQILARKEERDALQAEIAGHEADRARLLASLGVESLDEASRQLERLNERDRLEERRNELTAQLLSDLRAPDLDAALEKIGSLDEASLEQEQALISERIERLTARGQELYGQLTLARSKLDAVGGDSAVAAIEAERATILLSIEDLALRYLKLRTGALAAGSALDLYRERHRSTMMSRASDAFRMITRGEYSGLSARPDKDRETLIGIPRDGGSRLTDAMSTGTRYQLYLALRLAGYEEFAEVRPPVPFIADDIMETFDELRSEEVFRLFGEMAGIGQVIYLTHHRHLCEIARTVVPDVKIHQL